MTNDDMMIQRSEYQNRKLRCEISEYSYLMFD